MARSNGKVASGLSLLGAFLVLALATPAQATPFITVTELAGGGLTLATDGITDISNLVQDAESVSFDGILHIPFGDGVLFAPPYDFVLLEPGGGISDVASVSTPRGTGGSGAVDWEQFIHFSFISADGPGDGTGAYCAVLEVEGTLQGCSLLSQTSAAVLNLNIQSVEEVPEPASLLLLGTGFVALAARRRMTRA